MSKVDEVSNRTKAETWVCCHGERGNGSTATNLTRMIAGIWVWAPPRRAAAGVGVAALLVAGSVVFRLNAQQAPARPSSTPAAHISLVDEYCLSCHDEDKKKGNLALDTMAAHDVAQHPDVWEKVVRKLRARQMPPIGKERPDDPTYDAVIASLETALDRAAKAHRTLGERQPSGA
jgi:cbb3-type cytochrome c oxidase subunit III